MRYLYFTIFLVSGSALMFEVSLTRIFSISLWYHFAFMVISIAMLGIGSAGTLFALCCKGMKQPGEITGNGPVHIRTIRRKICAEPPLSLYAALSGISVLLCYILSNYIPFDPVKLSWEKEQFLFLALYCLVLSVPFFFTGLLFVSAFSLYSEKSMSVYSSDLLGAGAGSLAVVYLLDNTGPEYAALTASTLSLIGAFIAGKKNIRILSLLCLIGILLIGLFHPAFIGVKISPFKNLPLALQYPDSRHLKTYHSSYSRIDTFRSPAVRFAPGLSLKYLEPLPDQIGFAVDGNSINVITEAGDRSKLRFLEFLPSSLVYELRKGSHVAVLDPKGGLNALIAKHYGSTRIQIVESNAMMARIIRDEFSEFTGGVFDRNTLHGYGRNRIRIGGNKDSPGHDYGLYDVIDVPMTDTSVSGVFGIAEDYRYTVEAFVHYLSALRDDGIMSISVYLIPPPRTEFRILATLVSAFEELNVQDPFSRIAAIRSWDSMTLVVKKSPLTTDEIERIREFSGSRRFDLIYYPGMREEEGNKYVKMPSDEYFAGFTAILNKKMRMRFLDNYLFDIKPVRDDNPFSHYYLKLANINAIYEQMGRNWLYFLEAGYLLPVIFIIIFILSVLLIMFPVAFNALRKDRLSFSSFPAFLYFSMLGIGFMFVEVVLIQKSILLLENPSYTVAVILTAILVSSGAGSMLSAKRAALRTSLCPLILSLLVLVYSAIHPLLLNILAPFSLQTRILLMAAAMVPLGFFMGIPFPAGIRLLGQKHEALIPWAWAINACISVIAPILAVMLALRTGFQTVIWMGALAYFLSFVSLRKLMK